MVQSQLTIQYPHESATTERNLAHFYANRIAQNPDATNIAQFINNKKASRRVLAAMRVAEDSTRNKYRIRRLSQILADIGYKGTINRTALLPIIGFMIFYETPHTLEVIPVLADLPKTE